MVLGIIHFFSHLSDSSFEDFFTTVKQDMHALMCYLNLYDKFHATSYGFMSSGGDIMLIFGSTTYVMKSLCNILNFIEIWLNHLRQTIFGVVMLTNKNQWVV